MLNPRSIISSSSSVDVLENKRRRILATGGCSRRRRFVFDMKATPERENGPHFCYKIGRFKSRSSRSFFSPKNRVISYNLREGLGVAKPQRYSARERRCVINSNLPNDPGPSSSFLVQLPEEWIFELRDCVKDYLVDWYFQVDISKRSDTHYFTSTKTLACSRSINRSSFEKKNPKSFCRSDDIHTYTYIRWTI